MSLVSCSLLIGLGACASGGGGGSEPAATPSSGSAAAAKPPKGVAAPAGSKLAKVAVGMKPEQVKEIMGDPTSQTTYMTGKAFMPWYFGPTHQTDWKYKGVGRVVFVNNRWSGQIQSVTRIDYDPAEAG
ncbi:MAG: hypothetical protein E4H11_06840 [Myxococcales bacterium]|nr:MAG: hypothetical protein E4H11_06840 [Myxococcales bacterium]